LTPARNIFLTRAAVELSVIIISLDVKFLNK
jgi:hypothetical protein